MMILSPEFLDFCTTHTFDMYRKLEITFYSIFTFVIILWRNLLSRKEVAK